MGVFLGNLLLAQLCEVLPQGMHVPSELEILYEWIEAKGFYDDIYGRRRGYLYPQDQLRQSWSDGKRECGTDFIVNISSLPQRSNCDFTYSACSGPDGSMCSMAELCGDQDCTYGLGFGLNDDLCFGS